MARLTEKQKQFLKKHNMWNPGKDSSTLGVLEKSSFKDFFGRKEKIETELARLPANAKKEELARKLQAAEDKAKNKNFKEAYNDLKQVKIEARREANGYSDTLSQNDLDQQISVWALAGDTLSALVKQLDTGMKDARQELNAEGKASEHDTLGGASEFLRDFKQTETSVRSKVTGLKVVCGQITAALRKADPGKQLADFGHQLSMLRKEHGLDVSAQQSKAELAHGKYIHQGKTLAAADVQKDFDQFLNQIDTGIRERKDISKFQVREEGDDKISDDTLMRNPTAWDDNPTELDNLLMGLAQNSKDDFDNVMFELKDVEIALNDEKGQNSKEFKKGLKERRQRALKALALLDQRDAKRFERTEQEFLFQSTEDDESLTETKDGPKKVQALKTFDTDSVVSDLTLPPNLKKAKPNEIQQVRQELKGKMELLLTDELKKDDSDVVFDLGLKTKEDFVRELAGSIGIDPENKKCSQAEKDLLDQMAEQMVATVREKYPNKAGNGKFKFKNKDGMDTEVPDEVTIGGKKYTSPKYLTSGGVGDVLRYQEENTNPPKYTVIKTLKDMNKRHDMVHELKLHRQANGGEDGTNSPYVVEMQGAVQGPNGEIYMAMEFADGGDLNDMGYTLAQATLSGGMSPEAREVLTQHMMRQAMMGMRQVQDNNLTHHDIKGMNYLIGSDGKVKVADFGSGQVGDDQGEVSSKSSHIITTPGYKAPEFDTQPMITGKADTYSLGQMLKKLSSPMQGHGPQPREKPKLVTALDKLKDAMTDPDPTKRPTLEAVLQTSYMTDVTGNYEQEKIDNLMKAVMEYNKHVASKVKKEMRLMVFHQGELGVLQKQLAAAKTVKDRETAEEKIAKELQEIKELQEEIDKQLSGDDSKPYIEGLQKASEELVHGSEGPKLDVAKLKFKDEYDKIANDSQMPANQQLVQLLTEVDQADDPQAKKKAAVKALKQAKKLEENLVEFTKTAKVEKAKLTASKLATDLRKLQQALKELAK